MSLAAIAKPCPPPAKPIHSGSAESWLEAQRRFSGVLPRCLDDYGRMYGSGYFMSDGPVGNTLDLFNPHDPAYANNVDAARDIYFGLREDSPQYYPHNCYPDENGLFPVGYCGDSPVCTFYLLLTADPEKYTVIFDDRTQGFIEFPNVELFEFVKQVLCNELSRNIPRMRAPYFVPKPMIVYQ